MWWKNIKFMIASFLSSLLGAQCVHLYYQPLADFEDLVQLELEDVIEEMKSERKD